MADKKHFYAAIMAGGGGTRLWPLSRHRRPKQLLELIEGQTLYRMAFDRLSPLVDEDHIIVLTVQELLSKLRYETPEIPPENFFLEPSPRGNAAAIGLAAMKLYHRDRQAVMAALTADHIIRNQGRFHELLKAAVEAAEEGNLVTLGIEPEGPDPTYGYIQRGEPAGVFEGMQAYRVKAFKEKPPVEIAQEYVASGEYDWNSGMFVWKVESVLDEIRRQMPDLAAALNEIDAALGTENEQRVIETVWPGLKKISIDYGIMEDARNVLVIPAQELGWHDVGDWNRLLELLEPDGQGNVALGESIMLRATHGSLVLREKREAGEKLIVLLGLENVILVETDDVLMVCDRNQAASVKAIVDAIAQMDMDGYL